MIAAELQPLTQWIVENVNSVPFGEISVTLKTHAGKTTIIEKKVTEKEQLGRHTAGDHGNTAKY